MRSIRKAAMIGLIGMGTLGAMGADALAAKKDKSSFLGFTITNENSVTVKGKVIDGTKGVQFDKTLVGEANLKVGGGVELQGVDGKNLKKAGKAIEKGLTKGAKLVNKTVNAQLKGRIK